MKIIKEGDPERVKRYVRFECEKCGCIFEADQHEYDSNGRITIGHYDSFNLEYDNYYNCECPCCSAIVDAIVRTKE